MTTKRQENEATAREFDGKTKKTLEFEEWAYARSLVRQGYGLFVTTEGITRFVAKAQDND